MPRSFASGGRLLLFALLLIGLLTGLTGPSVASPHHETAQISDSRDAGGAHSRKLPHDVQGTACPAFCLAGTCQGATLIGGAAVCVRPARDETAAGACPARLIDGLDIEPEPRPPRARA